MPSPLAYDIRRQIIARRQAGERYAVIACAYGCSVSGVKKIWYAWQKDGEAALAPNYSKCGRPKDVSDDIWAAVDDIRDNMQGASYVYSRLLMRFPQDDCPSIRTIQRRWKAQSTNRKKGRPHDAEKKAGRKLHMRPGN